MRTLIIVLFSLLFSVGCKTKKDYQLKEIKTSYINKLDSSYIDSINGQITTFRSYVIALDSNGKPSVVNINEAITETYSNINKGKVIKDEKGTTAVKNEVKKVDREGVSINYTGLIISLLLVAVIIYLYNKK